MDKIEVLTRLANVADDLDSRGMEKEADAIAEVMEKVAQVNPWTAFTDGVGNLGNMASNFVQGVGNVATALNPINAIGYGVQQVGQGAQNLYNGFVDDVAAAANKQNGNKPGSVAGGAAAAASAAANAVPQNNTLMNVGSQGPQVSNWQHFLVSHGLLAPNEVDGIYGPRTQRATATFQQGSGITVDGIAGPETYGKARAAGYKG